MRKFFITLEQMQSIWETLQKCKENMINAWVIPAVLHYVEFQQEIKSEAVAQEQKPVPQQEAANECQDVQTSA